MRKLLGDKTMVRRQSGTEYTRSTESSVSRLVDIMATFLQNFIFNGI